MADPMTTETATMFLRQRDDALRDWGRLRSALLEAVDALETVRDTAHDDERAVIANRALTLAREALDADLPQGDDRWAT